MYTDTETSILYVILCYANCKLHYFYCVEERQYHEKAASIASQPNYRALAIFTPRAIYTVYARAECLCNAEECFITPQL